MTNNPIWLFSALKLLKRGYFQFGSPRVPILVIFIGHDPLLQSYMRFLRSRGIHLLQLRKDQIKEAYELLDAWIKQFHIKVIFCYTFIHRVGTRALFISHRVDRISTNISPPIKTHLQSVPNVHFAMRPIENDDVYDLLNHFTTEPIIMTACGTIKSENTLYCAIGKLYTVYHCSKK